MGDTEDPVELFDMHIAHMGINANGTQDAEDIVSQFQTLMGLKREVISPASIFAGTLVEVMKENGRGEKGHIGFHVNNIDAAEKWFAKRGFEIDEASRVKRADGSTYLVYFKQHIAGFAIHLTVAD
jgi:2-dehydro-3-deoxyphosphogluconate aldolase/(4S)-4-hydroxy-2-oxoglutarate aldolase